MAAPIAPISGIALPDADSPGGRQRRGGSAFQDVLGRGHPAGGSLPARTPPTSVERFLSGEGEELHTTILATQQAELSFDLFLQVRNKVVSAYQEIMRMQM